MEGVNLLNSTKKNEIKQKAKDVTKASEKFQLSHATYACQTLIRDLVIESYKSKYDDLSKKIEERILRELDYDEQLEERNRLEMLIKQKSFHIDVAYIETTSEDAARVIKLDNSFVINLSKDLERKIFDKDGNYNYNVIRKIRHLMAHELGHLILHTDELLNIDGTQGSKLINDDEKEDEASCFGEQLINLRKERNAKIYHDGGAHTKF